AAITRALLFGSAENRFPFCFFYPAIVTSAWLGGFYPGLLASVASAAASKYLFMTPVRSFAVASNGELIVLLLFAGVGIALSLLSEALIRASATNETLRERYARSEERFGMLAANAPVGIFVADRAGACLFVNGRWCELAGMTAEEARGSKWLEAVHRDDRARVAAEWARSAESGGEWVSEYRLAAPAGRVTWVRGNAVMHGNGSAEDGEVIGTVVDITNTKRADEERERLLARAEQARQDAEIASRAKDEFLALLS